MKEIVSTISSQGQITVPAEVRRHLGVAANEKVAFVIDEEGTVRLVAPRFPTVASLAGAAGSLAKPVSWNEMRQIAREDRLAAKFQKEP
jgi:antitoxin PrlF